MAGVCPIHRLAQVPLPYPAVLLAGVLREYRFTPIPPAFASIQRPETQQPETKETPLLVSPEVLVVVVGVAGWRVTTREVGQLNLLRAVVAAGLRQAETPEMQVAPETLAHPLLLIAYLQLPAATPCK